MTSRFSKRLLTHLQHPTYEPSSALTLAQDLGVAKDEFEAFVQAIKDLESKGEVVWGDDQLVSLPPIGAEVVGVFRKNPKGFGFIIPQRANAHGDLFVPAQDTLDAVSGDTVRAEVTTRRGGGGPGKSPYVGVIVEVMERSRKSVAGEITRSGGQWLVEPDGKTFTDPIIVHDAPSKNAKVGDKVIVEILSYPEGYALAEGVITRVLGESGEPSVETAAVIEAYGLPGEFPESCVEQAREESSLYEQDMKMLLEDGRELDETIRADLRDDFICTIDPPDAKDYDDAISIEKRDEITGGGPGYRLGVHIADVSHFVYEGSALDIEASDRCNSVYLPRLVIPMLPEILSNGICSLQEGVPRYTKSVWIDYDMRGNVRGARFAQGLIKSRKRLTYLEAQALIDGKSDEEAAEHAREEPEYPEELRAALGHMNDLSRAIRDRRKRSGMIHLDLPDVELVYDEDGRVIDAVPEDDAYTHTLIEMFMVEANEAVARLFEDLEVPIIRRTHPEPVPGNMGQLRDFVRVAGYRIPKSPSREELQKLLESTAGTPAAPAVHFAVLRTLTRAEYSPALVGHFALASQAYAHFTSPIRRYADLTVHRALLRFLELTDNGTNIPKGDQQKKALGKKLRESDECPDEASLTGVSQRCNRREDNATSAERELRAFLVLQLLENHIGESFPGVVTGVTNAGVFVRLDKYLAEGLCKSEDIPAPSVNGKTVRNARWSFDRDSGSLVERSSGRSYSLGDRVSVVIADVNLGQRQMSVVIEDTGARDVGKRKDVGGRERDEFETVEQRTGAQRRAQRSRSRDKRKSDFRSDKKGKGKRQ